MKTLMLIVIILFLLLKTQKYIFLSSLYQQRTIKTHKNVLANDLKNWCIGMNIKQKVRIKIQQASTDILLNQSMWDLTY